MICFAGVFPLLNVMRSAFGILFLLMAGAFWGAEAWLRGLLGLKRQDNCLTWAMRRFDYMTMQAIAVRKSLSGWFGHILLIDCDDWETMSRLTVYEYVPKPEDRIDRLCPPWKFDGVVKITEFERVRNGSA